MFNRIHPLLTYYLPSPLFVWKLKKFRKKMILTFSLLLPYLVELFTVLESAFNISSSLRSTTCRTNMFTDSL